jgi:hypothetical protein
MDWDEDRSQVRTASAPPGHGHLAHLAITILRLAAHASPRPYRLKPCEIMLRGVLHAQ